MEFGKSLREAREAKGYTISQIAEMTHIKPSVVEGLEKEDFSTIAAPIYGRGFVKLYCEAVGLEAKPFVDEFMAIINGEHEIAIKERPVAAVEPDPVPAVTPPPPPQEPVVERDLFTQDEPVAAEPTSAPEPVPTPEQVSAAEPKADISRYASPFRSENRMPSALPAIPWRLVLLGISALALLIILICGIRALYRATSASPAAETSEVTTASAKQSETGSAVRARQQDVPALYID